MRMKNINYSGYRSVEAIGTGPGNLEAGAGFVPGNGFRIAVAGEARGEVIGGVEDPGIACFGREEDKLVSGDDASVARGPPVAEWRESRRRVEVGGGCT